MRQIQIHHIKFKFTMTNSNSLWQFYIHHGTFTTVHSPQHIQIYHTSNSTFTTADINVYHSKFKFATAVSNSLRQIQVDNSKFKFTAANPTLSRQIQIHQGKLKFTTSNSNSPRQIQIHHGKFKFTAAISNSPRQIQIYHSKFQVDCGKSKFTMSN